MNKMLSYPNNDNIIHGQVVDSPLKVLAKLVDKDVNMGSFSLSAVHTLKSGTTSWKIQISYANSIALVASTITTMKY